MSHAMIWSDWEFEMILVTGTGEPLWAADGSGKYLTEWWVGGQCAAYLFARNEIEARDRAVELSKARGGNWEVNLRVTKEVYLHTDDRGPLAMTSSWEEGVEIGGGFDVWIRLQGKRPERPVAKG